MLFHGLWDHFSGLFSKVLWNSLLCNIVTKTLVVWYFRKLAILSHDIQKTNGFQILIYCIEPFTMNLWMFQCNFGYNIIKLYKTVNIWEAVLAKADFLVKPNSYWLPICHLNSSTCNDIPRLRDIKNVIWRKLLGNIYKQAMVQSSLISVLIFTYAT
jgi:hypothetical protein